MTPAPVCRGRFAPSPTGPLHFGSLVAALGSYLPVRRAGGEWLVRMEDLDEPRTVPGAADAILRGLERFGLTWDGPVVRQSARKAHYQHALDRLIELQRAYPCACSRAEERAAAEAMGLPRGVYPGTCRAGLGGRPARSWRFLVQGLPPVHFTDATLGAQRQDVTAEVGDFTIRRADGLFAYQLAVVVDDADAGITEVVRGADLLDSTARQILLQNALGLSTPGYRHLPVAVNAAGEKLSKQTGAPPVDDTIPGRPLWQALDVLGQDPPAELHGAGPDELLPWAVSAWEPSRIPCGTRAVLD
ncbi:MAG: tRNA glutamyl-Q(34) synthetase GluQRS [Pseudomonadota bacterium]